MDTTLSPNARSLYTAWLSAEARWEDARRRLLRVGANRSAARRACVARLASRLADAAQAARAAR